MDIESAIEYSGEESAPAVEERIPTTFVMPANAREVVISPDEAFRVALRLEAWPLARIAVWAVLLYLSVTVFYSGFEAFSHPLLLLDEFSLPAALILLFILICVWFLWRKARTYNMYGIPILYGFDEAALYSASRRCLQRNAWTRFVSWRELDAAFLLSDGVVRHMLPKRIWSAEELNSLRAFMRANVGTAAPSGGAPRSAGPDSR